MRYRERRPEERMAYLRRLRQIIEKRGSDNIVYVDESGFEASSQRNHAWGLKGKRVHGEQSGNKRPRTSVIAGRRKQDWLAPMIYSGTANKMLVNRWFEDMLCRELRLNSTIIWDNARFHSKVDLGAIAKRHGHVILFLPAYSPDFNPIENDFAVIKTIRRNAPPDIKIDDIIKTYRC